MACVELGASSFYRRALPAFWRHHQHGLDETQTLTRTLSYIRAQSRKRKDLFFFYILFSAIKQRRIKQQNRFGETRRRSIVVFLPRDRAVR